MLEKALFLQRGGESILYDRSTLIDIRTHQQTVELVISAVDAESGRFLVQRLKLLDDIEWQ